MVVVVGVVVAEEEVADEEEVAVVVVMVCGWWGVGVGEGDMSQRVSQYISLKIYNQLISSLSNISRKYLALNLRWWMCRIF